KSPPQVASIRDTDDAEERFAVFSHDLSIRPRETSGAVARTGAMRHFPSPASLLLNATRSSVTAFWIGHWVRVVLLFPILVARHVVTMAWNLGLALVTYNRTFALLDGKMELTFVSNLM